MAQADTKNSITASVDPTQRRFVIVAAVGSIVGAGSLAHGEAIDAQDEADGRYGFHSDESSEADDRCLVACRAVNAIDWKLATTPPTTLAGVAAVLRFANEIEDGGMEWPKTDVVGAEGWHYQLRATMAAAIEALMKAERTVQS